MDERSVPRVSHVFSGDLLKSIVEKIENRQSFNFFKWESLSGVYFNRQRKMDQIF